MKYDFVIVFCISIAYTTNSNAFQDAIPQSNEQRIIDKIFHKYHDPYVRPIKKREDTIVVKVGITYHQLIDVNEKEQIITSSVWIRQNWTSKLLTWNKTEFGDVEKINTDPRNVWKPDLYLYNNADESSDGGQHSFNTKVKLRYNGINLWLAPTIVKTACKINVEHFPFDEQFCDVTLGSWTYDTRRLNVLLEKSEADTSKFVSNGEWSLVSIKGRRNEFKYPCCEEPYADLTFTIRIRRRTRFYYINLIVPCVVITALSILTFKVPPDTGERITLVITNLLSMIVFLLLVADILPPISDATPLISIYYACVMFEIGFSLICTCIVLKVNFKHPSHGDMPSWFRTLVLHYMAKLFGMTPQVRMAESQKKHFLKSKRKASVFTSWIPRRFSVTRLSNGAGKRPSVKLLRKSSQPTTRTVEERSTFEEKEGRQDAGLALNKVTIRTNPSVKNQDNVDTTEMYRGSMEDTVGTAEGPQISMRVGDGYGGTSAVRRDSLQDSSSNDEPVSCGISKKRLLVNHQKASVDDAMTGGAEDCSRVFDDSLPECEHQAEVPAKKVARFSKTLATKRSDTKGDMKCLACSQKSAVHIMVHQQDELVKHVESLADMARDTEEEEIKKEEWKLAAAILDEFFFWLYLIMVIVSHAAVFSKVPKYD